MPSLPTLSMNLNMTVGQAACQLLCRYTQKHAGCVLRLLNHTDCYTWLSKDERRCGCSCFDNALNQWHNWRV